MDADLPQVLPGMELGWWGTGTQGGACKEAWVGSGHTASKKDISWVQENNVIILNATELYTCKVVVEVRSYSEKRNSKSPSRIQLFATPWTVGPQAPLSMAFSRQEYWSGLPFPPPGDLLLLFSH